MNSETVTMTRIIFKWLYRTRLIGAGLLAALACTLASAQTSVSITSPAQGAVISSPSLGYADAYVNVVGNFGGSSSTTISVFNGVNSTVLAKQTSATTYTAEYVPLVPGNNTLTVTALQRDGTSATASVTVVNPQLGVVLTSPVKDATFTTPASVTLQAAAQVIPGNVQRVEYYRLAAGLIGSATTAPYTYVWSNPPTGAFTLFARVIDDAGRGSDSQEIVVTVSPPNQPPVVSLTAPTNGAAFQAPANITLQANASDPDGTVSLVEFFNNGNLLGATNTSPYSFGLSGQPAGTYNFTARATDNKDAKTTSAPVTVTVSPSTPPTVSLTSPTAGSSYLVPANVQVSANASAASGSITKVDFAATRSGVSPITATATSSPYTATLPVTDGGTYALTAIAYDSNGVSATSDPITISVSDGVTYLHNDFTGNPIAATDSSGTVVWKENYKPYGSRNDNPSAEAGNRIAFHGKPFDQETGLSYFGARYYDPVIGRFMGVDAARFDEENLQTFNRYGYGNNNPYRFLDPDGNQAVEIRSPEWMRAVVPGQVMWDNARTALANGNYSSAAVLTLGMIAEAGMAGATGGTSKAVSTATAPAIKGTTSLFRAVGPAELADIKATGALRNLGSAEGKYFTTSAAEASAYAKQAVKAFGDQPYTIIRTDVPNSIFKGLSKEVVDRGIPAWVIPTERLPGLVPRVMDHSPLPPVGF